MGAGGVQGVVLTSRAAGGPGSGMGRRGGGGMGAGGMAPVPPGTMEKKTMFSMKTPWQI